MSSIEVTLLGEGEAGGLREGKKAEKHSPWDIILLKIEAEALERKAESKLINEGQARLEKELERLRKLYTDMDIRLAAD